jgi:hypothetical protein
MSTARMTTVDRGTSHRDTGGAPHADNHHHRRRSPQSVPHRGGARRCRRIDVTARTRRSPSGRSAEVLGEAAAAADLGHREFHGLGILPPSQQLLREGEQVVDVPTTLSHRTRRLSGQWAARPTPTMPTRSRSRQRTDTSPPTTAPPRSTPPLLSSATLTDQAASRLSSVGLRTGGRGLRQGQP